MIQISKYIRYSLIFFPLLFNCGINTAGGGVIVNNPCVMGTVEFPEGHGAHGAMVIIGCEGESGSLDTSIEIQQGDFYISYDIKMFDTVFCDVQGKFSFEDVSPGSYVLVAERKEVGMLAMTYLTCNYNEEIDINLKLEPAAKLTIKPYYFYDSDTNNFIAAQIAGTMFTADFDDSTGLMEFGMAPAGELELVLFRADNTIEVYQNYNTASGTASTLLVDPHRSSVFWTAIEFGPRDPLGRPYILSSSPSDGALANSVNQESDRNYDIEIQFSHPMDSKQTNSAISVMSSDGLTSLDSIWWQGGNVVYLKMCTMNGSGECNRGDSLYRSGVTYFVTIDTIAETSLGVRFAYPDTLMFVPKP